MPSSSSSTSSSSSSQYMPEPVLVYPPARTPFEKPGRSSFRIITPASHQNKRKRDLLDSDSGFSNTPTHAHSTGNDGEPSGEAQRYPEMNQFRVAVREPLVVESPGSAFGPTGKLKAKPPKPYPTPAALLAALRTTCIEDPEVDFSGSYVVAGPAAGAVSDKERVQMVINDVWRATGYRFTVKDHPKCERGHKTRLWCSQDEARRSKHRNPNDAPRLSKQGELFAKQRYPCRSRLMITCVPEADAANNAYAHGVGASGSGGGGGENGEGSSGSGGAKVVTIRMHHYMRHEAYVEAVAAAEESRTQPQPQPQGPPPSMTPASAFLSAITAPLPAHLMAGMMRMPPPPPPLDEGEGEWDLGQGNGNPHPHPYPHPHSHQQQQQYERRREQQQESEPEPEPEMSPTPSPHFSPQAQARFAPPPPPPQEIVIDPQLQHQPLPPPPPQITMTPPYQNRTTPPTSMTMQVQQQQHSPPTHPRQHSPPSQMPPPPPPTHHQQQQPSHPHQPSHPQPHAQLQQHPPPPHQQQPPQHAQLTPAEFQHRMRTHITRIRDFCDGLEYQLQFNDYRMLEALERDAAPFLGMVGECLGLEGR